MTIADVESESLICTGLRSIRPHVFVLGEEAYSRNPAIEMRMGRESTYWVDDPLDGTSDFAMGTPNFGVMAALIERGKPKLGAVLETICHGENQFSSRVYVAEAGKGAFVSGFESEEDGQVWYEPVRIPTRTNSPRRPVGSYHPDYFSEHYRRADIVSRIENGASIFDWRTDLNAIAKIVPAIIRGQRDVVIQSAAPVWDVAAAQLILKEAGGHFQYVSDGADYDPRRMREAFVMGRDSWTCARAVADTCRPQWEVAGLSPFNPRKSSPLRPLFSG